MRYAYIRSGSDVSDRAAPHGHRTRAWPAGLRTAISTSLLLVLSGGPAHAQTSDDDTPSSSLEVITLPAPTAVPETAAAAEPARLEEVIVTARRRAEVTQKIPISLAVLDGDALAEAGIIRTQDMQQRVPNLVVSVPNTRLSTYTIRGLGSSSFNDGMESSVGLFLDGIYLGRQGMSIFDLIDLERVEILRGPQGTLYGKNTTAGAISVTTRKPQHGFEATGEASLGNYGFQQYRGSVTGGLSDTLAGRLTAYSTRRDGLIDNVNPDGPAELNDWHKDGARGQLLWEPGNGFSARLIGEYGRQDEQCCVFLSSDHGILVPLRDASVGYQRLAADPYARRVDNDAETSTQVRQKAFSAELNQELGNGATLTSLTGWRDWHFVPVNEDGSGLDITPLAGVINDHRQLSQELRYTSAASERFEYTLGAFYLRQDLESLERVHFGADAAPWNSREAVLRNAGAAAPLIAPSLDNIVTPAILDGARRLTASEQTSDSYALFGQLSWHLTPKLELTPGLRYTRERKRAQVVRNLEGLTPYDELPSCGIDLICYFARPQAYENLRQNALGGLENGEVYRYNGSVDEDAWTGQLALSYAFSDTVLGYGSVAQGVKAGGLNIGVVQNGAQPTFRPEKAATAELGLKSQFWQRRAQLNVAVYQTDVRDYQALTYTPGVEIATVPDNLVNVGKVRIQGAELDLSLRPTTALGLRLGAAYNRAKYREFPNAPAAPEDTPLPPAPPALQDLSGEDLYNSPRWTTTAGAEYRHPLALFEGELYSGLDYAWRSGYYASLERGRGSYVDAYGLANLRLGLRSYSGRWDVALWLRNAFDEDYYSAVLATQGTGTYGVIPGDPRTYGITLRSTFN